MADKTSDVKINTFYSLSCFPNFLALTIPEEKTISENKRHTVKI